LNIRDLKYLVAVHDLNNFSKAAERCFVSQPTLSGQLKKLEEELGTALIERSTRQVLFTPLGEQVVSFAREALLTVDNIYNAAKQCDDPLAGEFHIGLIPTVGPFLLPMIMPILAKEFPRAKLFLYELKTQDLIDRLLKGELDAAILAKLNWSHAVRETQLYREPMKLAIDRDSALNELQGPVELSVLENQSVLMLEDGHCLRDQAIGVCFSAGAKEDERFKATSMDTLLHMVSTGAGITLIPELACSKQIAGVNYVSFVEPQPTRDIVMLTRSHTTRKPALDAFAKCIQNMHASLSTPQYA
jgi:LysR family hydrogen peroxide-inducible transcriptional activator